MNVPCPTFLFRWRRGSSGAVLEALGLPVVKLVYIRKRELRRNGRRALLPCLDNLSGLLERRSRGPYQEDSEVNFRESRVQKRELVDVMDLIFLSFFPFSFGAFFVFPPLALR